MAIEIKNNTLVFIEETALKTKHFISVLDEILQDKKNNILFLLDNEIEQSLENYKKNSTGTEQYVFEGFLDIIKDTNQVKYLDTNNYFEFKELEKIIKTKKSKNVYVITQKESVYFIVNELKSKYDFINIKHVEKDGLKEWEVVNKIKNAFYVEKNKFNNQLEIKNVDFVYSPKFGSLKLQKDAIYEGGEGFIYKTYANQLVKIYHKEHQTYINQKKLQQMLELDIFNPYINWPKDIIFYDGYFAGYLMDEIKDAEQLEDIRADGFKGFGVLERYEICYNFIKHMLYLHQKDIVVGDLKLDNILIRKPNEVFMIDCGSYQVGDYPCVVYHPDYTQKMYTEEELQKYLRVPDDEYFAINTIIFELLVGKKPNYDRDSGDINGNRKTFLYPLDIKDIDKNSPADLRLWALMSPKMREMFHYYFTQNKVSYLPEWISEIKLIINNNKK